MSPRWTPVLLCVLATTALGCGRLGFDELGFDDPGGAPDAAADAGIADARTTTPDALPDAGSPPPSAKALYWTDPEERILGGLPLTEDGAEPSKALKLRGDLSEPAGLLVVPGDAFYWLEVERGTLMRADPKFTSVDVVTDGLEAPEGLGLGPDGFLYWTDGGTGRIERVRPDGSDRESILSDGVDKPFGLAIDAEGGFIYWVDSGTFSIRRVGLPPDNGQQAEIVLRQVSADDLSFDPATRTLYWTSITPPAIFRASVDEAVGISPEKVADVDGVPNGLVIDPEAQLIYWSELTPARLMRMDYDGGNVRVLLEQNVLRVPQLLFPESLALN